MAELLISNHDTTTDSEQGILHNINIMSYFAVKKCHIIVLLGLPMLSLS